MGNCKHDIKVCCNTGMTDMFYLQTVSTPELLPEEGDRIWSKGTQNVVSSSKGIVQKFQNAIMNIPDYMTDPRVGPFLLLCACLSFGAIWFRSSSSPQKVSSSEEVR